MASVAGSGLAVSVRPPGRLLQVSNGLSSLRSVSFTSQRKSFVSIRSAPRLRVSCAAKPETVEKVCLIVRKQLAIANDTPVTGESMFSQLGADSLDTVEIVMGLEEEFGVSVEEESAQSISTVQHAADMIELLLEKKKSHE